MRCYPCVVNRDALLEDVAHQRALGEGVEMLGADVVKCLGEVDGRCRHEDDAEGRTRGVDEDAGRHSCEDVRRGQSAVEAVNGRQALEHALVVAHVGLVDHQVQMVPMPRRRHVHHGSDVGLVEVAHHGAAGRFGRRGLKGALSDISVHSEERGEDLAQLDVRLHALGHLIST